MNRNPILLDALILISLALVGCVPATITVNIPTINPPQIGITLGGDSNTPSYGNTQPAESTATPGIPVTGSGGASDVFMFLVYGALVVAGVAILIALFALLRRPDA